MYEYCAEAGLSLQDLLLLNPIGSAIGLLVLGAMFWLLWTKLKAWWKLLLVPLIGALGWLVIAEPANLGMKRAAALELAQTPGEWQSTPPFELKNAAHKVLAFRTKLGSKCNSGFLVKSEAPMLSESWGFVGTVPHSPAEYRREKIQQFVNNSYNVCYNRAQVMWGEEWRKVRPNACSAPEPKLLFFDSRRNDPHGFEMKWCTRLNVQFAYCEAEGVALATGIRF